MSTKSLIPGYKTVAFWASLLIDLSALLTSIVAADVLPWEWTAGIILASKLLYVVGRWVAKARALTALLILALGGLLASCSWWSSTGRPVASNVLDCTKQEIVERIPALFDGVVALLPCIASGPGCVIPGGAVLLSELARSGLDVLACTIEAIKNQVNTRKLYGASMCVGVQAPANVCVPGDTLMAAASRWQRDNMPGTTYQMPPVYAAPGTQR